MSPFVRDVLHAVRVLASRPVLTATTVATLAIGIGGTSAMFAVADGLLLRPLPVPDADRLVRVFGASDIASLGITSFANLVDVADRARSFAALTIHQQTIAAYGLGDDTTNAAVELVSGGYFTTFQVAPGLGRALTPDDDQPGAARVAVVSDRWWRRHFAADRAAIGRTLHLNGSVFTVVGVAPASFHGSYDALATDLWVPLMTYDVVRPRGLDIRRRTWGWLQATARLAPGASLDAARTETSTIAAALRAEYPRENRALAFSVVPASSLPESMTPVLSRGAEIAVRMALGASRGAIVRQWLAESLVANAVATALGLLMAVWLRDALFGLRPLSGYENFAPTLDIGWAVWACAALLMAVATCLSGVLPALRAAHLAPAGPLRDGAAANIGGSRGQWVRTALVSAQAGVALALVVLAGLLGQSVATARRFDLGFDRSGLVIATANVSALGHDEAQSYQYHAATLARVRALPGAAQVTAASVVPLGGNDERRGVVIEGYTPPGDAPTLSMPNNVVWPGYFEVMGIPLIAGRTFAAADGRPGAPLVAVVNQTMAAMYWASGDPIGRRLRLGEQTAEVVGVVKDIAYYTLGEAPLPYLYLAYGPGQPYRDGLTFHVRTGLAPAVMARQLSRELRALDPRVRVVSAMSYDDLRAAALFPARAMGWLSTGFAVLALALLLVGTYGVTSYVVAGRRRELALRVALGAAPELLRVSVVRRALLWGAPGALAGVLLSLGLAQLLRGTLVGVTALDPLSLVGGAFAVVVTSAAAAYVPARRVGRIDLATELRP
jgi:putative ABC transport system permease protein